MFTPRRASSFATLMVLALLTVGCVSDNPADPSSDSFSDPATSVSDSIEVTVSTSGGELDPVEPRRYVRSGMNDGAWTTKATVGDQTKEFSFDQLNTYQYIVEAGVDVTEIKVLVGDAGACSTAFRQSQSAEVDAGVIKPPILATPTTDQPVQITLIPWSKTDASKDCDINTNFSEYITSEAVAVWLSVDKYWDPEPSPDDAIVCKLQADEWAKAFTGVAKKDETPGQYVPAKTDQIFTGSSDDCVIDQIGSQNYKGENVWAGPLFTMITTSPKQTIFIDLGDNQTFLAKDGQVLNSEYFYDNAWHYLSNDKQIIVTGTSRIDGDGLGDGEEIIAGDDALLGEMLALGSSSGGTNYGPDAIDISGVTVSNSPTLGHSPVRLNDPTLPMWAPGEQFSWDRTNRPVKVWDFKRPGNWRTASDGIEPGGDGSSVSWAYLHVNDDAIKVSANVEYDQTTILQGGAGAPINLGSYGFSRGITSATIDGVYIHRIIGNTAADDDGFQAIVTTRTCPIKTFSGSERGAKPQTITGIWIKNIYVNSLGYLNGGPGNDYAGELAGAGPNQVLRPFAIGVMGSSDDRWKFCEQGGAKDAPAAVTLGDWTISNMNIFMNPLRKSVVYDHEQGRNYDTTWEKIRFCGNNGDNCNTPFASIGDEESPVTVWPYGAGPPSSDSADGPPTGYYVCGVETTPSQCWTINNNGDPSEGQTTDGKQATMNLEYDYIYDDPQKNAEHWDNKLVFPFGSG